MREMKDWREYLIERLAVDREEAIGFLQAVLEDYPLYGNVAAVVSALEIVVESRGGISELAAQTGIKTQTLSKVLHSEKAPRIDTLSTILKALGCRLSIEPLETERSCTEMGDVDAPVGAAESAGTAMELTTDNQ